MTTSNQALQQWINEVANLTKPERIVWCDGSDAEYSGLVAQMLDKLVDNAASFTPEGGRITLALDCDGSQVDISVSNDGPLLPEAMQQQLFDSMVSVREKSERVHLGLGLHIVRLIVDFHGGTVWAENREDGSGVTFVAALPLSIRA